MTRRKVTCDPEGGKVTGCMCKTSRRLPANTASPMMTCAMPSGTRSAPPTSATASPCSSGPARDGTLLEVGVADSASGPVIIHAMRARSKYLRPKGDH